VPYAVETRLGMVDWRRSRAAAIVLTRGTRRATYELAARRVISDEWRHPEPGLGQPVRAEACRSMCGAEGQEAGLGDTRSRHWSHVQYYERFWILGEPASPGLAVRSTAYDLYRFCREGQMLSELDKLSATDRRPARAGGQVIADLPPRP